MNIIVVGIDPGKSTGLAALRNGKLDLARQVNGREALRYLIDYFATVSPTDAVTIAYERFTLRNVLRVHSPQPDAMYVIGMLRTIADQYHYDLVSFRPDVTKSFASNALLRRLGLYVSPRQVDQRDANDVNDAVRLCLVVLAHRHATLYRSMLSTDQEYGL